MAVTVRDSERLRAVVGFRWVIIAVLWLDFGHLLDEGIARLERLLGVGDDVRVAQVLQVVGPAVGVQDQVPIDPPDW